MSRVGKAPIPLPSGVTVEIAPDNTVTVKGARGTLSRQLHQDMKLTLQDGMLLVERPSDSKLHRSLHGLTRALAANMVTGVTQGFTKSMEITGVGYRVAKVGNNLVFQVGYSHPVLFEPPPGVAFVVDGPTRLSVTGTNKEQVGEVAAQIRRIRKPEPYKGKGIRYANEVIRRKAGKAGKVGGKKK
jgi:large subunit ribosomal protein L6